MLHVRLTDLHAAHQNLPFLPNRTLPLKQYQYQTWPSSVKGGRHMSPKICPKLWLLATGSRHNKHIQMKFVM